MAECTNEAVLDALAKRKGNVLRTARDLGLSAAEIGERSADALESLAWELIGRMDEVLRSTNMHGLTQSLRAVVDTWATLSGESGEPAGGDLHKFQQYLTPEQGMRLNLIRLDYLRLLSEVRDALPAMRAAEEQADSSIG